MSGRRESDSVYKHPMLAYYRYTTARPYTNIGIVIFAKPLFCVKHMECIKKRL